MLQAAWGPGTLITKAQEPEVELLMGYTVRRHDQVEGEEEITWGLD
jgi:hypothetical protein